MIIEVENAKRNRQTNITIAFGSLVGFTMSGKETQTLQADQLNVIVYYLDKINTKKDFGQTKKSYNNY